MNIGIAGNTNNYPFILATALRKRGCHVHLLLLRPEPLHHPESGGLIRGQLPSWIMDGSEIGVEEFETQSDKIGPALNFVTEGMDAVILNDIGPSLSNLIALPAISLLTGSDLTYSANFESSRLRRQNWDPDFVSSRGGRLANGSWETLVLRQRDGIRASRGVSFPSRGLLPDGDAVLDNIGVNAAHRMFLYYADTAQIEASPMPKTSGPLRILNGARLNWVEPMPADFVNQDHKGTNVLLRGFRLFLDRGGAGELTLVEKGLHVPETRALVSELGLKKEIIWLPEMPLDQFHRTMGEAQVVCDQFGKSMPGMVALTTMALGRVSLANFQPDILNLHYDEPWPVCHAQTPDEIADRLLELHRDRDLLVRLGLQARAFAEKHLSPDAAAVACIERLSNPSAVHLQAQLEATQALAARLEEGRLDLTRQIHEAQDDRSSLLSQIQALQDDRASLLRQIEPLSAASDSGALDQKLATEKARADQLESKLQYALQDIVRLRAKLR